MAFVNCLFLAETKLFTSKNFFIGDIGSVGYQRISNGNLYNLSNIRVCKLSIRGTRRRIERGLNKNEEAV